MSEPSLHRHSPSAISVIAWLLLAGGMGAGFFKLYEQQQHAATVDLTEINTALAAQGEEIAALRRSIANPPAASPIPLEEMNASLVAMQEQLKQLQESTKQSPAEVPAATRAYIALVHAVYRHQPYAAELDALTAVLQRAKETEALRALAAAGLPSDLALRAEFDRIASPLTPNLADAVSTKLGGLVTIKRQASTHSAELKTLPLDTPLATLAARIEALPEAERAPYVDWIARYQAQRDALTALESLSSLLLPSR